MKLTVHLDKNREEEIVVYAHEKSDLVQAIERLVGDNIAELIGYKGQEAKPLILATITGFIVEQDKVYALTEGEKWQVKRRLYQLEDVLPHTFIKLNQSCIANIKQIVKFDASLGGALRVTFRDGYQDYVSRRNVKLVKERLGL